MINRPTTITAMNRPAIAGTKYRSARDGACVGCGDWVAAVGLTTKLVSEDDP